VSTAKVKYSLPVGDRVHSEGQVPFSKRVSTVKVKDFLPVGESEFIKTKLYLVAISIELIF
jgi:hypothetical protein